MILTSPLDSLGWARGAGPADRQDPQQASPASGEQAFESSGVGGALKIGFMCGNQEFGHQVHRSISLIGIFQCGR